MSIRKHLMRGAFAGAVALGVATRYGPEFGVIAGAAYLSIGAGKRVGLIASVAAGAAVATAGISFLGLAPWMAGIYTAGILASATFGDKIGELVGGMFTSNQDKNVDTTQRQTIKEVRRARTGAVSTWGIAAGLIAAGASYLLPESAGLFENNTIEAVSNGTLVGAFSGAAAYLYSKYQNLWYNVQTDVGQGVIRSFAKESSGFIGGLVAAPVFAAGAFAAFSSFGIMGLGLATAAVMGLAYLAPQEEDKKKPKEEVKAAAEPAPSTTPTPA